MDFSHVHIPGAGQLYAALETSMGDLVVRLFEAQAPNTVRNFVGLATGQILWTDPRDGRETQDPLYDGTIFHRVIPGFMIQGGDPLGDGTGDPGYTFRDEFNRALRHGKPGILSMANSGPHTNGSQFFVTEAATPWLDGKHTIFGEVVQNVELIATITHVRRDGGDRPAEEIVLRHVRVYRA